ncbi:MAG: Gfo/Idh/MocA family oxidoreductase [Chloroflexi bacterium]|nr:Gfo/Idh/MocA family oxidoreductase [Chloroflexota bacterium]
MTNFALTGAAGYIAPRHLKAIRDTGNKLIAALDPHDAVGIIDSYFPETYFFTEPERFERFLDKQQHDPIDNQIQIVSICSPNYLHDAHIRMALHSNADALCEKPIVINPWNLDRLSELEVETGHRVYTVLQLRVHPSLMALKRSLEMDSTTCRREVILTYITRRGRWYDISWKGAAEKSGGLVLNIGVHFFDLCLWLFGPVEETTTHLLDKRRSAGVLELERARVRWFLSIEAEDLPEGHLEVGRPAFRSITIDGTEVEFSEGFGDLHTEVYSRTLSGQGFGINDARPSIELVHRIRTGAVTTADETAHPLLRR